MLAAGVAGCGGGEPRACPLMADSLCAPGCGGPFHGREVVESAECLAGEVPLFCTTQSGFPEAIGCVVSPDGAPYWTSALASPLPEGWRECDDPERAAVTAMAPCQR